MRCDHRVLTGQKHESFTLCLCSKRFFGEVFFAYPSKKGEVERVSATTSPESPRYLNLGVRVPGWPTKIINCISDETLNRGPV